MGHDFRQAAGHVEELVLLRWSGRIRINEQIDGHQYLAGWMMVVLLLLLMM